MDDLLIDLLFQLELLAQYKQIYKHKTCEITI